MLYTLVQRFCFIDFERMPKVGNFAWNSVDTFVTPIGWHSRVSCQKIVTPLGTPSGNALRSLPEHPLG